MDKTPEEHWRDLSERILTEITEWRRSHPKATFREIEDEVHMRMSRLEAQLIQDTAQQSQSRSLERSEPARAANLSCVSALHCMHAESANASCKEPEDKQSR